VAYVLIDVGGTQIKARACYKTSPFSGGITVFDAKSGCEKDEIFRNFAEIIRLLLSELPVGDQKLSGVGMAFPGPFDYKNGISLMRGLGKYDAIYGCDIRQEIKALLSLLITDDVPFAFLHDVEAFAVGEIRFGAAVKSRRAIHLCIGTGAGSAFTENGAVLKEPTEAMPENGWIYNTAFRDGIIDDYVSVRGLARISGRFFDSVPDGAALAEFCSRGDSRALKVFSEFGKDVCEALRPFIKSFKPDTLVLGGQISKSFFRFSKALEELCDERNIKIAVSHNTSESIMKGLWSVLAES
jgi:Transcriptional regulator/sugar kinase